MNERILKLAKKSGATVNEGFDGTKNFVYGITMSPEELEKFAELIVKECAKICIEQNVSNLDLDVIRESGKFTLQDLATKSCGENLSNQIKKHFGVEE